MNSQGRGGVDVLSHPRLHPVQRPPEMCIEWCQVMNRAGQLITGRQSSSLACTSPMRPRNAAAELVAELKNYL